MLQKERICADAGTQSCPCSLADYGKCLVCSRLTGGNCCSCDWQGVCIYNEYMQNNSCIISRRKNGLYEVDKVTWYEKDLVVMRVSVPRGLAQMASLPGSFVFLKAQGMEDYYSVPVSVMRADYEAEMLELAVKINGPKTQALCGENSDSSLNEIAGSGCAFQNKIELRGIYRNGILGAEKLMEPGNKNVLCLAKGTGLAPVVNYVRWSAGRDDIDIIVDLEKINRKFADDALYGCAARTVDFCSLPENLSWAEEDKYDLIIISASDHYQQSIYVPDSKKVLSNNHSMCCGEGICGSCIKEGTKGTVRRMCKSCRI